MSDDHNTPRATGRIRSDIAHNARVWNYWLGGKDNYLVNRTVGDQVTGMYPSIGEVARADRAFLGRAVRHLTEDLGVRQFLDIGTGLPTVDNTHEVAQRIAPSCAECWGCCAKAPRPPTAPPIPPTGRRAGPSLPWPGCPGWSTGSRRAASPSST